MGIRLDWFHARWYLSTLHTECPLDVLTIYLFFLPLSTRKVLSKSPNKAGRLCLPRKEFVNKFSTPLIDS